MAASTQSSPKKSFSSNFEDVAPWEQPVDGEELLDELRQFIQRYVVCDEHTATAATLWITFTWFIDVVTVAPIANITAPLPNCGKSTLLDLMGLTVKRPLKVDNVSPAAIFRTIDMYEPTLLIDEVDAFLNGNEDARGILNSGHKCNGSVIRLVGNNHEPQSFSTWGAKALCGIGSIASTLDSRSIRLELRRKLPGETVENLRHVDREEVDYLVRRLSRFALDNHDIVKNARPTPIPLLDNRSQDNWEPLLAISEAAGGIWPNETRITAVAITGADNDEDMPDANTELLRDIKEVFENARVDRIFTAELILDLCNMEEAPWKVWNRGNPITSRQLSKRLKDFGIRPADMRLGGAVRKGYALIKFSDAFNRYLPCTIDVAATPLQPTANGSFG
jgi:hypothetical protein